MRFVSVIPSDEDLVLMAKAARENAYAPYSHYRVGAALLADDGEVFTGCNVENASYGLTNCAERTALFKAVSEGKRDFRKIAISLKGVGAPCGACRQALYEFAPDLVVLLGNVEGKLVDQIKLKKLLPIAFGPKQLKDEEV